MRCVGVQDLRPDTVRTRYWSSIVLGHYDLFDWDSVDVSVRMCEAYLHGRLVLLDGLDASWECCRFSHG